MPTIRQIKPSDDLALVNIVLDYIRGHSIDEVTLRLNEQCKTFDIACTNRYQAIKHTDENYNHWLNAILDELSIGAAQLHLMDVETAKAHGKYHSYVWNGSELIYLQSKEAQITIALNDESILTNAITQFTNTTDPKTLHLFANQIQNLITHNSESRHTPQTTDLAFIERCRSSYNLYDALNKLKVKHPRLSTLLDIIGQAKPAQTWWLYLLLATGLTATTGFAYYLIENFALVKTWYEKILPIVSSWFNNAVNLLKKTPIVGIVYNGLVLLNAWYQAIMNGSITDGNKLVKLSFKTLEHTLPIIGYILCYLAAGTMTIPAVAMFITGAVIDVVESLYLLIYHQVEQYIHPLPPATEYHSAAATACADNVRERNLYISLVTIAANLLTTASIVIWCIFPASLVIALPCLLVSTLVGLTKNSLISHIKNNYAHSLQSDIKDIGVQYHLSNFTKKDIEMFELRQRVQALERRNLELTIEMATIQALRTADRTEWMVFFQNNQPNIAANGALEPGSEDDKDQIISYN